MWESGRNHWKLTLPCLPFAGQHSGNWNDRNWGRYWSGESEVSFIFRKLRCVGWVDLTSLIAFCAHMMPCICAYMWHVLVTFELLSIFICKQNATEYQRCQSKKSMCSTDCSSVRGRGSVLLLYTLPEKRRCCVIHNTAHLKPLNIQCCRLNHRLYRCMKCNASFRQSQ